MIGVTLEPVDTLFFRDATPFASGSASQADVGGVFPPPPPTVTGAIRAALARANGWSGSGSWGEPVAAVLGDGPDDLGRLAVTGPLLVRDGEILYPAPRHLVGTVRDGTWEPCGFAVPGEPVRCDLGEVRLPVPPDSGADSGDEVPEPPSGLWLTGKGLAEVVRGRLPPASALVPGTSLWREERRVGIARDRETRAAERGMLYGAVHVRLLDGVALGALVDGIPPEWRLPEGVPVPLGGEGRIAIWRRWRPTVPAVPEPELLRSQGRVALLALTPLDPGGASGPKTQLPGLEGLRLVAACCDPPDVIGGWDSVAWEPRPRRRVLPAGTVLFFEIAKTGTLPACLEAADPFVRAGHGTAQGFGVLMPMLWPGKEA